MKKSLSLKETFFVASMLFGMFFGAGNLIFPVSMGQLAGSDMWPAAAGFLITGVGLPLLGVAALGISRKAGLLELSSMAGRKYGMVFTCALYLTIGPFFAIPRCATVSFTVGLERLLPGGEHAPALPVFSFIFFAAVLFFSLRPGQIVFWEFWLSVHCSLRWEKSEAGFRRALMPRSLLLQDSWKDTIQWMPWRDWRSAL